MKLNRILDLDLSSVILKYYKSIHKNYKIATIILISLAFLAYGQMIIHVIYSDDAYRTFDLGNPIGWNISLMRYSSVLELLVTDRCLPFFSNIILLIMLVLAGVLLSSILNVKKLYQILIFSSFIALYPYNSYIFLFPEVAIYFGFAILFPMLALYIFLKTDIKILLKISLMIPLLVTAFASYSSALIFSYLALFVIFLWDVFNKSETEKFNIKMLYKYIKLGAILLISVIIYAIVGKIMQHLFHRPSATYQGSDKFIALGNMAGLIHYLKMYYFTQEYSNYKLFSRVVSIFSVIIYAINIAYVVCKKNHISMKIVSILLISLLPIIPFFMYMIHSNAIYHVIPMASLSLIYGLVFLIFSRIWSYNLFKSFIIVSTVCISYAFIKNNNIIQMVGYYHDLATKQLYNRLLVRITSLANFDKNKKYDVVLIGSIKENTTIVGTKVSWFTSSSYTFGAIGAFNYYSKINNYNLTALSDQKLIAYGKNYFMNNRIEPFPCKNSIYINGSKIYINLSS